MRLTLFGFFIVGISLLAGSLFIRNDTPYRESEEQLFQLRNQILSSSSSSSSSFIDVMTFNIRLDALESNPANHFTQRVTRLRDTILKWRPAIVGLQEPFASQTHHLLSVFPEAQQQGQDQIAQYRALGYVRPGIDHDDKLHPARHDDFNTAILYRTDLLDVVEQDHLYLTEPVRNDGRRTKLLNIAHLRTTKATKDDVLVFNVHLDVKSENNRRLQSAAMRGKIDEWRRRYPKALVFATGDFNSAPGQSAHRTLVSSSASRSNNNNNNDKIQSRFLNDAWETCAESASSSPVCTQNTVALSFHGWIGEIVDKRIFRLFAGPLFTLHAMQFHMPLSFPTSWRQLVGAVRDFLRQPPEFGVAESLPKAFFTCNPVTPLLEWLGVLNPAMSCRYHVDWVLHDAEQTKPRLAVVADVRGSEFSSDHFPVYVLFEMTMRSK